MSKATTNLFLATLCILFIGCYMTRPPLPPSYSPYSAYSDLVTSHIDMTTGQKVEYVSLRASEYDDYKWRRSFNFSAQLVRLVDTTSAYQLNIAMSSGMNERPPSDSMYVIIDNRLYKLKLNQVDHRNVQSVSGSGMSGNVSISTQEFQYMNYEAFLDEEILNTIKPTSEVLLAFHAGVFPITFKFSELDIKMTLALVNK